MVTARCRARLVDGHAVVADLDLGVPGHEPVGVRLDHLGENGVGGQRVTRERGAADLEHLAPREACVRRLGHLGFLLVCSRGWLESGRVTSPTAAEPTTPGWAPQKPPAQRVIGRRSVTGGPREHRRLANRRRPAMLCRGRSRQRVLVVAHPRQRLPGMPPPLLPALLRRLGWLGRGRRSAGAHSLRPEAARHAPDVGGPAGPRGRRALSPGAPTRACAVRGLARRGHRAPDAGGVEGLA